MPTFTVKIDTENEAFADDPRYELARILRVISMRVEDEGLSGFFETILDANGNDVGRFALKPNEYESAVSR